MKTKLSKLKQKIEKFSKEQEEELDRKQDAIDTEQQFYKGISWALGKVLEMDELKNVKK
jgi:hypothetical protein